MSNKLAFYFCFFVLFGCGLGDTKSDTNNVPQRKIPALISDSTNKPAITTTKNNNPQLDDSWEADSLAKTDPDTAFSMQAMRIIADFPEIKMAENYIDSASNHKRIFVIILQGMPSEDEPYYQINAGEQSAINDSDDHFVPYMHFNIYHQINSNKPIIKYYSTVDDAVISLTDWRKKENELKKEGKKDYFFCY
ncbi:MAG TPA: hypothetical protein VK890_11875 [Bacteroidia bacterium]|jgi:hypothetical protein|nr:hypothetical protein [Bacteroidia bacterium]